MTPAQSLQLAALAVKIAIDVPEKFKEYQVLVQVWRKRVEEIRAICDEAGFDWRTPCRVAHKGKPSRVRAAEPRSS